MLVKLFPWSFFQPIIGLISFVFISLNILICGLAIHGVALMAWLLRRSPEWSRQACDRCYRLWAVLCEKWFCEVLGMQWHLDEQLRSAPDQWHLVIANHRSWVDAFLLLAQVQGRLPMPRIFMKDTLVWLPLVGTATKIMGFPQVKRYSRTQIAKRPELVERDKITTRKACTHLIETPSSIMSFAEGTRFSVCKHRQQQSPYQHLLKPKAGGVWLVLNAMPGRFHQITDLNITYGSDVCSFWDLLCGRMPVAQVTVRHIALPNEYIEMSENTDKQAFFEWFNGYWQSKDRTMMTDLRQCSKIEQERIGAINNERGFHS